MTVRIFVPRITDSDLVTPDERIIERFLQHNPPSLQHTFCETSREADLIVLFQAWSFKQLNYSKKLINDPIFKQHCNKTLVVNYDSTVGQGFIPGCYVSLRNTSMNSNNSTIYSPIAYPKEYNEALFEVNQQDIKPDYLFGFRGTTHSHIIRKQMFDALEKSNKGLMVNKTQKFHTHTEEEKLIYAQELKKCKFALCPRGSSPNSYRLFEAMSVGRCPVIISDEWVEMPKIKWDQFSIGIQEQDIPNIEKILTDQEDKANKLGLEAKKIWQQHFCEQAKYQNYLQELLKIHKNMQSKVLTINDYKKLWSSHDFKKNNEWLLSQKLMRKINLLH